MENHLYLIAQSPDLPAEISSFKSWTAKRLLEVLQKQRAERILKQLAFYKKAHKQDRDYQVWEEGSHPEQIQNPAMMLQKIEYIHQNPVKRGCRHSGALAQFQRPQLRREKRGVENRYGMVWLNRDAGASWPAFPRGAREREGWSRKFRRNKIMRQ
ncbi:hypothetical protein [Methylomicrobium lacus]|uniref:hypothetical protein n=1 Tax=Methylomicrobium lacus TaxID=136992 RepID=UPI0004B0E6B8|nr:hypothetical protein [Methylomicrobium lacus]